MNSNGRSLDATEVLDYGHRCDDLLNQLIAASEVVGQCHERFMWVDDDGTEVGYTRLDRARAYRDQALHRYRLAAGHATRPHREDPGR